MSNLTRANPTSWAFEDELTSDQVNHMDESIVKAPNYAEGCAFTPTADIELTTRGHKYMGSLRLQYEARTVVRQQPLIAQSMDSDWEYVAEYGYLRQAGAGGGVVCIPLTRLIHGAALTNAIVVWDADGVHAADPPDVTFPILSLEYYNQLGVVTSLGTQTDTTTVRASYEAKHTITKTPAAHTIDLENNVYYVRFTGETGADYRAGGLLWSLRVTMSVSEQSEG